jgi:hypothetical protein
LVSVASRDEAQCRHEHYGDQRTGTIDGVSACRVGCRNLYGRAEKATTRIGGVVAAYWMS